MADDALDTITASGRSTAGMRTGVGIYRLRDGRITYYRDDMNGA